MTAPYPDLPWPNLNRALTRDEAEAHMAFLSDLRTRVEELERDLANLRSTPIDASEFIVKLKGQRLRFVNGDDLSSPNT